MEFSWQNIERGVQNTIIQELYVSVMNLIGIQNNSYQYHSFTNRLDDFCFGNILKIESFWVSKYTVNIFIATGVSLYKNFQLLIMNI